ncbi:MAG: methyltransferase domain-containing protein [Nitrospira sp.]|nr:methyltransferase domain-containing protein [Nitrospira sp.]
MPTTYQERFGKNDDLIHAYANDNSPRASEIQYLYDTIKRLKARRVLNVPFEGSLIKSVATNEQVTFADFIVPATLHRWNIFKTDFSLTGIPRTYFDVVISIAGIHHLTDQDQFQFIAATQQVLKAGGRLLMVEVTVDSPTSRFLDGFVGRHTPTGHVGNYLKDDFVQQVELAGYQKIRRETIIHEWVFRNKEHIHTWMTKFFGFSVPKNDLITQVDGILGINEREDFLTVNWPLDFVSAQAERTPRKISSPHRRDKTDQSRPRANSSARRKAPASCR